MINALNWLLQANEMKHDKKIKQSIMIMLFKVYDLPIFYLPKLSHPDPTVDSRSGFLPPIFGNSKNLGQVLAFLIIGRSISDKDLTFNK